MRHARILAALLVATPLVATAQLTNLDTAAVTAAMEREMRRQAAEQDAQVLRENGPADDLDELVRWSSSHLEVED